MNLIQVRNAGFSYENRPVITHLNFHVQAGNYLCIVGENGSGKSTLIKGLLRLKQPACGSILYQNALKQNELGYLPQQTSAQKDFPAGVYEVVLSGRLSTKKLLSFYSKEDKRIARENMALLGISNLENRCYRELSGGQQQRVLLARALCATKKLLLLDEPTAGLDPLVTQAFYETIADLNKKQRLTIIMVSHDMQSAVKYASHVLHLQNEQVFFGTAQEYLKTELAARFTGGGAYAWLGY